MLFFVRDGDWRSRSSPLIPTLPRRGEAEVMGMQCVNSSVQAKSVSAPKVLQTSRASLIS